MARDDAPPFERGSTAANGVTIDSNDLILPNLEGKEWVFEDLDYTATTVGARPARTNQKVRCRAVRNSSGAALLPKRLVTFKAGDWGKVDGYAEVNPEGPCFPVDEWLPAAGVPSNDLFWIVVEGPATVLTGLAADATNVINQNDQLVNLTAVTSGATTAGRAGPAILTGLAVTLAPNMLNIFGRALSARTTGNTNSDVLVEITKW